MTLGHLTNEELVAHLRTRNDLSPLELALLERLIMALDEVDELTGKCDIASPYPGPHTEFA